MTRSPRRALALLAIAALLAPGIVDAAPPPPPARPGPEVVNPYVTPFVYAPANSTYEAYRGFGPVVPTSDSAQALGSLAAAFDYDSLAAIDSVWWTTDESINESDQGLEWQAFVFYVSPALSGASSITFTWKGYGAFRSRGAERTYLMAYNFAEGRFHITAETGFSMSVDQVVTGETSTNVSSYISGNRIVLLVASEQGPPADIGDVGRPGGRPVLTTYVATDYIEVRAFLPTPLPALSLPQDYTGTPYARYTFRGPTLWEEGNITVGAGATLELDHTRLVMNGSDTWIRVEAGGSLRVLDGSRITDAPGDVDDGNASDSHYWIEVMAGGEVYLENATVENAGVTGGPLTKRGLYVGAAAGALRDAEVAGRDTGVVAEGTKNVTVESLVINHSGGASPDLQLLGEALVEGTGLVFSNLAISPDSTLLLRTALTVLVRDSAGNPIRGADLRMTEDNVTTYASPGYGGTDPRTGRVTDFDDNPAPTVLAPVDRSYLGRTTPTAHATQITAKYFEWSETRTVSTAAPHEESFAMALASPAFHDAASTLGYDRGARNFSMQDSFGPAVAVIDYNNDGLQDLFVAGGATRGEAETPSASPNRLYRHETSGAFTDVTDAAGLTSKGANAAAWGDYDNDGDADLFLVYQGYGTDHALLWPGQADSLYRNLGDGTFENVTVAAGVGDTGHGSSAAWGDYDGDGWLDLYVGNTGWVLAWLVRNESSTLYHNNRDGTFTDVTTQMGVNGGVPGRSGTNQTLIFLNGDNATERARDSEAGSGFVQAVAWLDYDRDGDLDLYLAEDFGSSVLYRNDGGTFALATRQAGLGRVGSARGVQVADIDGDGWLDILQANRWVDFVWRNNGDGTFTDIAPTLGLDEELPGTTPVPIDIDLDGRLDLFVAGGRTSTFHAYAPSYLWHNRGTSGFADITAASGVAQGNIRTMGAASADLDGDGDPDLVTANADTRGSLFINDQSGGHFLKVRLNGTASPRDGQGAQVRLIPAGASTGPVQQLGAVSARGSGQPHELLFAAPGGAPSAASPWTLDILWPSGVRQLVNVTARDLSLEVTERATVGVELVGGATGPEGLPIAFEARLSSTDPEINQTAIVWWKVRFADDFGADFFGRVANHSFNFPGRFPATVTVRDRTGGTTTLNFTIVVVDTTAPLIETIPDAFAVAGAPFVFSGDQVGDNDPAFSATGSIVWTFTDGGEPRTLTGRRVPYSFSAPGDYTVTVTATDGANNTATRYFVIHVTAAAGFGVREIAIIALALAAAAVAAMVLLRSRGGGKPRRPSADDGDEEDEAPEDEEDEAPPVKRPLPKKRSPKERR